MQRFSMGEVDAKRRTGGGSYREFPREQSLSMGPYVPWVGDEDCAAAGGDVLYVAKGVEHGFHPIV